ncbi:MAG TPA: hypothetical protein VLY21_02905 [Nitrososphaerales archaeon]|nr:hypothetical protein [Nitrososphaerales archaeon]
MRNGVAVALVAIALVIGAGTGYVWSAGVIQSRTVTETLYRPTSGQHLQPLVMEVNGSLYNVDDVSNDTVVQNPGYSYFVNGSIAFEGVRFATICPPYYSGCPGGTASQVKTIVMAGAIMFNMTFPISFNETAGGVIGDLSYAYFLSHHIGPRAGILIESGQYPRVFLLVSPLD